MKSNQHWAGHLPDQLHNFSPVYAFWAFLGEQLNKHLKNFNSSSHKGGQLEISMMHMFTHENQFKTMVSAISFLTQILKVPSYCRYSQSCKPAKRSLAQRLSFPISSRTSQRHVVLSTTCHQMIGTPTHAHLLGNVSKPYGAIPEASVRALVDFYNSRYPNEPPVSAAGLLTDGDVLLSRFARYYDHVLLGGRRVTPLECSQCSNASSSLVKVK